MAVELFTEAFLSAVELLVTRHHSIYPKLPPQGIFLEALVEQAFLLAGWPRDQIVPTTPNSPWHDLLVGGTKLSIKSETGKATRVAKISITKLCTTETGDWNAVYLVSHAIAHLGRYDRILMLRAVWDEPGFLYQLLEIPLGILRRMQETKFAQVGKREGRRSLAADVMDGENKLFRVHFDGADGKCQIRNLLVDSCRMLRRWREPKD
jgi:hypothetical protein